MQKKMKANRNRTLSLTEDDRKILKERLVFTESLTNNPDTKEILNKTICADLFKIIEKIPDEFADLIIIDPPYNLSKNFDGMKFNSRSQENYDEYLQSWLPAVCKKLKDNGSLYICGDWKCTSSLQRALEKELCIMNRITWQREKAGGRKATGKTAWKTSGLR